MELLHRAAKVYVSDSMNTLELVDALQQPEQRRSGLERVHAKLVDISKNGLPADETALLTIGLARSGLILDWRRDQRFAQKISVDLPSTGGNSNKTPIIAPLLALGAAPDRIFVPKLSSRGRVAGTIDILKSVGYRANLSPGDYANVLQAAGLCNVVQTTDFVPADGKLMALRREIKAMDVPALVVSSILSKKLATGCRNIVIDLKAGEDSKFGDLGGCVAGARLFIDVGKKLRKHGYIDSLWVCVTNSYRPQGRAFGRIASLWEAARVLGGHESGFLCDLCICLAARMLILGRAANDIQDGVNKCRLVIGEGALATAERWLAAHGARTDFLCQPDTLLETLARFPVSFPSGGRLLFLDTKRIGNAVAELARPKTETYAAGFLFNADPRSGEHLTSAFDGIVLASPGHSVPGDAISTIGAAAFGYAGSADIIERPTILYDLALIDDGEYEQEVWTRRSKAALALIRSNTPEPKVLLFFNKKWGAWNLVAGHFEEGQDANIRATMTREIVEELGEEIGEPLMDPDRAFRCNQIGEHSDLWFSSSTKEWTYYDLTLFAVVFNDPERLDTLVRHHPDQLSWATLAELRSGILANGNSIAAFPAALLAIQGRI